LLRPSPEKGNENIRRALPEARISSMEITGCGDDRYEVAKEHACRLLYVGDDFVKTDIEGVL
jgi:hypothetical protein